MYSSSPQTCHYYNSNSNSDNSNNNNSSKHDTSNYQSLGRCTSDTNNHSSHVTSDPAPSSWNSHLEQDYNLGSPTPSTSPSFHLPQQQQPQHYSSIVTPPTSTPYVLSHPTSHHHQPDLLLTPTTPTTPSSAGTPLVPSYGYGLSHRGFFPRPKLTTTLWEDERTVCFQVDANGICVARREDNDMINGTKLLNVAGMSRGKRDGILKNEKGRVVVKVGAMHLKGVWITFDRAKTLSAQFKIQDVLYPLFVDNPQTFLYSHPMTSPISRLGSFRPFYPPSWDRTIPSSAPSPASPSLNQHNNHHHNQQHHNHHHNHHHHNQNHHHHHNQSPPHGVGPSSSSSSPSDTHYDTATSAPFGYRPGGPLFAPHSSSYGSEVNNDTHAGQHGSGNNLLSMDYRSGGTTSDSLTDQVDSSSSPSTSHGPSSTSTYYNDLLDPSHRSNDMSFYNPVAENNNRDTEKLGISTVSSLTSNPNGGHSLLDNHESLMDTKRSSGTTLQPSSAFQAIDTTTFHHPQPVYMDTNSRGGDYHPNTHPLYLDNPASSTKGSSILNGLADNSLMPYSDHTNSSRRDNLAYPRSGMIQRHHPYANPSKLSNDPSYSPLKKLSSSSRLGSSARPLTKELDDLSVKNEADHSIRPW